MKTEAHDARRQGIYFAIEGVHRERIPVVCPLRRTRITVGQTDDAKNKICVVGAISRVVGCSSIK